MIQIYKGSCIRVEVGPDLSELRSHLIIEHTGLLDLGLIVALEDHGDEQLQEYKANDEVIA